jgi:hypothetical protein
MAVAAHDDEIHAGISGVREQRVGDIQVAPCNALDRHFEPVSGDALGGGQIMFGDVRARREDRE